MKKIIALMILVFICISALCSCKDENNNEIGRESISDFTVATFEFKDDDGYKLITSQIDSLDTFDSLLLKPAENDFEGEWIYRIVFNPSKCSNGEKEFVILFGENSVSVNGKNYIGDDIPYSEILSWAETKYAFFDYELMKD